MGGYYKGEYREEAIQKLYEDLDLSQEQQGQLKERRSSHGALNKEAREIAIEKKKELKSELEKEIIDEKKIKKIAKELKRLESKMIDQRIQSILDTREILTYDQYNKFKEKTEIYKKHRYADWGKEKGTEKIDEEAESE